MEQDSSGTRSQAVTRGVQVEVQSVYVPERSSVRENYYFCAYRVSISNLATETVQLISRVWVITDANGKVQRVAGPGVVGEQPTLPPGGSFEYTSFCPLTTEVGSMEGSYAMVTSDGERFDAEIASFTLCVPHCVN